MDELACDKTGQVRPIIQPNTTSWDARYTFTVVVGLHGLSFSVAKLLDVCWDLIVGRLGQVVVTVLLYRIFRPATVVMLQNGGLRHEQILAMQYSPASFWTFCSCVRDVFRQNATASMSTAPASIDEQDAFAPQPSRTLETFRCLYRTNLVFATMYLLAYPTWISAMIAYQNPNVPVFQVEVGNTITLDKLDTCIGIIVDGTRVGLTDNACINVFDDLWFAVQQCEFSKSSSCITPVHRSSPELTA